MIMEPAPVNNMMPPSMEAMVKDQLYGGLARQKSQSLDTD